MRRLRHPKGSFGTVGRSEAVSVQELDLVVAFLDVGHGDSTIVRFREGHQVRTLVVDGGGPSRSGELLSYLLRNAITTVDLLVATHIDRSHITGLIPVAESERVTIHNFWGPSCESTQPSVPGLRLADERAYQRLYSKLTERVRPEHILCPTRGMPLPPLFSDATLTVLNPVRANLLRPAPSDVPPKKPAEFMIEQNEASLVLHMEVHGIRLLLGADIEGHFWAAALNDSELQRFLDVNIFKMPNYGRPSGFPPPVAQVVRTEYAVFSIGAQEDKQPSADVVTLLRDIQAEVLCTEHAAGNTFCGNAHCHAAHGGQNVVFCRRKGDHSYSTSAYCCPLQRAARPAEA
jgi:beta-lactamase superfamily II metal-dependent hydrolase